MHAPANACADNNPAAHYADTAAAYFKRRSKQQHTKQCSK
jgi:hypothetical protein